MDLGSRLVAVGLAVVLVAVVLEYFEYRLSGMAVGFGLVIVGFLLLMVEAVGTGPSSAADVDRSNRDG